MEEKNVLNGLNTFYDACFKGTLQIKLHSPSVLVDTRLAVHKEYFIACVLE